MIHYHPPTAIHRRWLLVNAVVGAAVSNALINGGLSWATLNGEKTVPLWSVPLVQKPSLLVTTLGTFFLLPLGTTLVVTTGVRLANRNGVLGCLDHPPFSPRVMARVPQGMVRRGASFGALVLVVLGPIAIAIFETSFHAFSPDQFILYSIVLSVVLGEIVTPVIALLAMADIPQSLESAVLAD